MRKISVTLAVMSVLAPLGVSALGIGDIRLRSSLNQTLNAEIPLVTSGSETLDDVKVSLASPEAFSKAGIERSYALTKLRFKPVQKRDGSYAIRVSSQDVIREPFLNFLLEVNWPQGRMLREFTVLLDPPSTFKEETVPSTELPETRDEVRSTRPAPEEDYMPRRAARSSRAAVEAPDKVRIRGASYGPVRTNETLSGIARLVARELGVSQDQAMAALYQANPQAFIRNNINALRAGQTLSIPDRDTILSFPSRMPREAAGGAPKQGRLAEQRPATAAESGETASGSQLRLLSPQEEKGKAGTGRDESGKSKGDIALEVADTVKQENEEIRSRLNELEQQLTAMQRLLTLKDQQIANLQGQPGAPDVQPTSAVQPTAAPAVATPAPTTGAEPAVTSQVTPAPAATPAQEAVPKQQALPPVTPPAVKPAVKPPRPAPPPPEEPSLLDAFLDEPLLLGTVGLGSLFLLGFIAWSAMRRRAALQDEAESILAPNLRDRIAETPTPTPILDAMPTEHIVVSSKSSFLSEFTPSDFDALSGEADEVDPISEADVYLAYGRYKQAEDLITSAIAQHPERDECKLKLLEIHYATENRSAFEKYAIELFEDGKDADGVFWDKVKEMGRELCPGNPLFSGVGDIKLDAAESAYLGGELLGEQGGPEIEDDFIAELKRFEEGNRQSDTDPGAHLASFDFDDALDLAPPQTEPDKEDTLGALDFEVPSAKSEVERDRPDMALDLDNLIPFEPGLKAGASQESGPGAEQEKTLDDILVEMGAKDEGKAEAAALDLDMGLDFPAANPPEAPPSAPTLDTSDEELYASLTDMDEQETKLDLAKAYIDMGDSATAREIIEDVLARGNEAQKKEATALLAKIEKS